MSKITCTLKSATARAIYVDPVNIHAYVNKEGNVTSVLACDELVSFFGDFTKESFNQACIKEAKKNGRTYVGLLPDSFIKDEVKGAMDEGKFLELAHVIEEGESKLGLITRTIDYTFIEYKYSDEEDKIHTARLMSFNSAPKALEKEAREECKNNGVYFVRMGKEVSKESVLVGMDKRQFAENCEVL